MGKKVLHLLGNVNKGGTEVLLLDMLNHCKKNKRDDIQLLFYGDGDLREDYISTGKAVQSKTRNYFKILWVIRKMVKDERIRIIHCHGPVQALYSLMATLGLKTKIILSSHGFNDYKITKWLLLTSFFFSDKVLFVSDALKNKGFASLKIKDREKYIVLHNGIDLEKMPLNITRKDQIKGNSFAAGMIGSFYNDVRDQLTVCKTANILKSNGVSFSVEFAGGADKTKNDFYKRCVNYVQSNELSENVTFLGFRDDAIKLLSRWDIFVYSSNKDSFGIAVVEAMISGIPVFVNDLDVFVEITENGKYATLYKTKDPYDLATKIMSFVKEPSHFIEKANKAMEYAREKFSIEKHFQNLNQIYNSLLADET